MTRTNAIILTIILMIGAVLLSIYIVLIETAIMGGPLKVDWSLALAVVVVLMTMTNKIFIVVNVVMNFKVKRLTFIK